MDVESIEPGSDFVEIIDDKVGSCDVLLALIGPRWVDAADETGNRRLEDPDDVVALEIATALGLHGRVIPVLVDGASMPKADDLPEDLAPLARREAVQLGHTTFDAVMSVLVTALEQLPPVRSDFLPLQRDADLSHALGVGASIALPAGRYPHVEPTLPLWVDREIQRQVVDRLAAFKESGGFLVLVGNSSVGKTRLLYESAVTTLGGWLMLAPADGDGAAVEQIADSDGELPPLIVWLDRLHRFLEGPYIAYDTTPIRHSTIQRLLARATPVVILGTLWPDSRRRATCGWPWPRTRSVPSAASSGLRHPGRPSVPDTQPGKLQPRRAPCG